MSPDTSLFLTINSFARSTPWLQPIVIAYAGYGVALFAGLMLAGWWIARRRDDPVGMAAALWTPVGMLIALGLNQPIADVVGRPRPYSALPDILVLAQRSTDPSFPSDHAVIAGAVTAGLFLVSRRLGLLSAIATAVMLFARVYIAAHYPLDAIAGLGLGVIVSIGGFLLLEPLLVGIVNRAERTPLGPLLTVTPRPVA